MNASVSSTDPRENGLTQTINRLRANPRIPFLLAAAAAIAVVVALALWAKTPDYRVLYSNLSDSDGGAIVTQLSQMNIPYRFSEQGSALLIPAEQVAETRLRLAQQGLPKGGAVGFELLDQAKFGISQFSEQINYQRALEGELSRTIGTLGPVQSARVHLAMPKPTLFVREQKSPSASVTLNLHPGRMLDDGQINAIVHMVSSSVAGLPPSSVTVVDQAGRLLTQSEGTGRDLNASQLKYAHEVESRLQRRIEAILLPMLGEGNAHAQVTAQIDFASREQTEEQYQPNPTPDKAAIRSQQLSQSEQIGGQNVGGIPGALSNQPAPAATAPIETARPATNNSTANDNNRPAAGQNNAAANNSTQNSTTRRSGEPALPESSRRDETTNYEVDRTIRHTQQGAGTIQRLSVAVVVNHLPAGEDGQPAALSDAQLEQINALVREAMGFSSLRGDSLNVVNTPFTPAADNGSSELPFWQQQSFFDQLLSAGRYLLVLLVAWILWRKIMRAQRVRRQELEKAAAQRASMRAEEAIVEEKLSKDEMLQRKRSLHRANTEVQSQRIREMSDQDPRIAALVIRQWMSNEL